MLGRILTPFGRRIIQQRHVVTLMNPVRRATPQGFRRQYATVNQLPSSQPEKVISAAQHFKRQKHLPFFLEYFMWVVFGSEALHLIWLKIDQQEYRDKTNHQIAVLKEVFARLERGEAVDDNLHTEISMLLKKKAGDKKDDIPEIDDEYLEKLFVAEPIPVQTPATPSEPITLPEEDIVVPDNKKKPAFFL
ncbi:hypothetical protein Unana1_03493 [Umbelopsis nana]